MNISDEEILRAYSEIKRNSFAGEFNRQFIKYMMPLNENDLETIKKAYGKL